jgi:alkyl hydroperoxide reductase subunit AhpC
MAEFKIGRRSPDFSLESIDGLGGSRKQVCLDDYIDGWLVLLFYPKDFSMI